MTGESFLLPTSSNQRRLWMVDRLTPGSGAYNIAWSLRLTGPLRVDALASALSWLVARHEALRTRFTATDGEPAQLVDPPWTVQLPVTDLGATPDELTALVAETARRPFDLERGPLLRLRLVRLAEREHVLVLVVHHSVADGWSFTVLFPELAHAYGQFATGAAPHLPPPPIQYGDFACWQQEQQAAGAFEPDLEYWHHLLAGAPTVLDLPADRPRPAELDDAGGLVSFPFPDELTDRVRRFTSDGQVTTFAVLLAAFQSLLHRLSGQPDLLVGVPVSGRSRPETREVVGFFANTVALRARFTPGSTFAEVLAAARDSAVAAVSRQDVPFERVVDLLAPQRSLAYTPVVQVLFAVDEPPAPVDAAGLTLTPELLENGTVKFDLTLTVQQSTQGLVGRLTYRDDLFDAARVRRLADQYLALLAAAVTTPDTPVTELPLLDAAQLAARTDGWRRRQPAPVPYTSVAALLAAHPAPQADAVAVSGPDGSRTHRELAARSGALARTLAGHGVGPDQPVGLCLTRGTSLVTAILGVWRAGAGYLPLDPDLPAQRLVTMAVEADVRVVLTDRAAAARTGPIWPAGVRVVWLDDAGPEPGTQPEPDAGPELGTGPQPDAGPEPAPEPPTPAVHGGHLAYLLYTSGSTGEPKGVAVTQHAVVHLLLSMRRLLRLTPADRVAAITTPAFDISVVELVLPLLAGARIEIIDATVARDAGALRAELAARGVTVAQGTPATWRMLLAAGGVPSTVRLRISGGEALSRDLADALAADGATVVNGYGPSETTIYSSAGTVTAAGPVDLGGPVGDTRLYLLDAAGRLVGPDSVGEVHIGGPGLARGYHRRPGLTAARFRPDPYSAEPGARLYATGDLARELPDGRLEYLGRADHQVKVRGYRIEPGEIESALRADGDVRDAVVTAWQAGAEDVRLVAYLVPAGGPAPDLVTRVRAALAQRLPEYMLPAAFVLLDALPRTASGKIDRAALPEPAWRGSDSPAPTAARTPVEEKLVALWAEVLGLAGVGVHDNFFNLGGHSLTATRLIARIRGVFGVDLPLRSLFAAPTVATLAPLLTAPAGSATGPEAAGTGGGAAPGGAGTGPSASADGDRIATRSAPEDLLATLDTLSDQEIDALLDSLIAEEGSC